MDNYADNYSYICALFAKHFGWTIDYTLSLSHTQIDYIFNALSRIESHEAQNVESKEQIDKKNLLFAQKLKDLKSKGITKIPIDKLR